MAKKRRQMNLITGASSGLGAGMARELAGRGRDLALCARRVERLEDLKKELESRHAVRVEIRALDVNDHDRVFEVFRAFRDDFGRIDRFIINAGLGKGQPLGTGFFYANKQTAETNFVAALAQCEAALEILRDQGEGHLVTIASMSAMRGMPKNLTTYAATKAGLAILTEGIRVEMLGTPVSVTTLYPGYVRSEINEKVKNTPFIVDTAEGCRALVEAMEKEPAEACVPRWPWQPIGFAMKRIPLQWVKKMG